MLDLTELANWSDILSLLVAILTIVTSIWFYRHGKKIRRLLCEFGPIISPIELKAGEGLGGDIEIFYKGQPIDNLFLLQVKLRNAGNAPIRKGEVVKPVMLVFDPSTKFLLPPHVLEKRPGDLTIDWSLSLSDQNDSTKATATFDLLNPGDEATTEFVYTGIPGLPTPTTRIEGVKKLEIVDLDKKTSRSLNEWVTIILIVVSLIINLIIAQSFPAEDRFPLFVAVSIVMTFGWLFYSTIYMGIWEK